MTDLEVLGLTSQPSPEELKRAYVRELRRHPPERDPEAFQRVRAAYERLRQGLRSRLDIPFVTEDARALEMRGEIETLLARNAYSLELFQDAVEAFPEEPWFRYHLARALMELGKTGLAVKELERLQRACPDSVCVRMAAAKALALRGWHKKALEAGLRALKMGGRETGFLLVLCRCLHEDGNPARALSLLLPVMRERAGAKPEPLEMDLYCYLLEFTQEPGPAAAEAIALTTDFLRRHGGERFETGPETLTHALNPNAEMVKSHDSQLAGLLAEIIRCAGLGPDSETAALLHVCELSRLDADSRLDEVWQHLYMAGAPAAGNPEEARLAALDAEITALLLRDTLLPQVPLVQASHPRVWGTAAPLLEHLTDERRARQRLDTLLARAARDIVDPDEWYFLQRFPDALRRPAVVASADAGSYQRPAEKIGRNDPCPCGSGKKYKNCCMRKEQTT